MCFPGSLVLRERHGFSWPRSKLFLKRDPKSDPGLEAHKTEIAAAIEASKQESQQNYDSVVQQVSAIANDFLAKNLLVSLNQHKEGTKTKKKKRDPTFWF